METVLNELRAHADECIDNGEPVHIPAAMSVGDGLPQGDIVLVKIQAIPPAAKMEKWPESGDLQLAPGDSRGSRHCIPAKYAGAVTVYSVNDGNPLSDVILEATGKFDLTHPEHADHLGYPTGVYRVHHQQTAQRTRVLD